MSESDQLSSFREQWQQELTSQTGVPGRRESVDSVGEVQQRLGHLQMSDFSNPEDEARFLFQSAVNLERRGRVFDALPLYKRAVHLVPDIEYRMHEQAAVNVAIEGGNASESKSSNNLIDHRGVNSGELPENIDLYARFWDSVRSSGRWCENAMAGQGVISTVSAHISDLPLEVLLIISRWIVSNELDVQSLEKSALVCKGLYLSARDPELWRLICMKVWGVQLGVLQGSPYSSWRQMYYDRSRLRCDGSYISKTSYFRYGENSFQDQSYKPVHNVEYYRYLRFFPDGVVLMLTTPDEPAITVKKLKTRQPKKRETMRGIYRLKNDTVTIMLQRKLSLDVPTISEKRSRVPVLPPQAYEQTFHLELKVQSSSRRKFNQLQWLQYRIIQRKNGTETTSEFPLTKSQYPMFNFSRVEHYSQESNSILA